MVDLNLTDLTENTTPTTDDIIYSVDAPATTKLPRKVTLANIKTLMSDSPTLVTPALGTPASGTLTNCTGLPFAGLAALTDGNILVGNGSNVAVSVNPSGDIDVSNAGVFSINSGVIVNADVSATAAINSTKITPPLRTETSSYTLVDTDEILLVNPSTTAFTVTLPAASGRTGKYYKIIYISSTGMPVIIDGNASETINGVTTVLIEHQYSQWELYCDGSNWYGIYNTMAFPAENLREKMWDVDDLGYGFVGVGTEVVTYIDGEANHYGISSIATGGSSGDDVDLYYMSNTASALNIVLATERYTMTFLVRINGTLANATRRYGGFQVALSNSEEGNQNASFLFDTATSAKWRCRTRDGATNQTTTDGGADVALNTWYKLKIVSDGGTFRFYINNVNIANHATNVPTTALTQTVSVDATSASSRSTEIDYLYCRVPMGGR